MNALVERAAKFAKAAHAGQFRKYTGEPYIVHPEAVAKTISEIGEMPEMIAAAWLHDVIEDCGVSSNELNMRFGPVVASIVLELTDQAPPEMGNRAVRKAFECGRLSQASAAAQTIKLADLIDNTKSIKQFDPAFWEVYSQEKRNLLKVLIRGDETLRLRAAENLKGQTHD